MVRDMTVGSPSKIIIGFALPMIFGNIFQQLYNIVDSVVVGNFVGPDALAAVGAAYPFTFLFIAFATGAAIGCSVVISQFYGAGRYVEMKSSAFTALTSMAAASILLMIVGFPLCGPVLRLMETPADIYAAARDYLRIYVLSVIFMFLYNTATAAFNALGDSRTPLYLLAFSSVLNIGLDLLFVIRYAMGVAGVAWATLIAQAAASLLALSILMRRLRAIKCEGRPRLFEAARLRHICRIAVPSVIQQSIVSMGILFVQTLVNRYGPAVIAGYTAATKIDSIAIMPMLNVGNAVSSFTAQNIGAGKPERVRRGIRTAILLTVVIGGLTTFVLWLFGAQFVGLFVDTASNADVIRAGVEYLTVVSVFYAVMGVMCDFNGALRGAGDMRVFMASTLLNFVTRVTMAYLLAAVMGEAAIWWSIPMGWIVGLLISGIRFFTGGWKNKSIVKNTPV